MQPTIYPPRTVDPAGPYDGVVVDSRLVSLDFRRCPQNPDGLTLRTGVEVLDAHGTATVYDACDIANPKRLRELAAAAGIEFCGDVDRLAQRLIGCHVRAVVRNITPSAGRNAGRAKAVVSSWIAATTTPGEYHHASHR